MPSQLLIRNTFILRRPEVSSFSQINKVVTIFILKIYKNSKRFKKIEITYQNAIYICILWYSKSCWLPMYTCWCQQNSRGVSRDSYIFWLFFRKGIILLSFITVGCVWQILRKWGHFGRTPAWAAPKRTILNSVKKWGKNWYSFNNNILK